jgi:hypothetical protein
MEKYFFIWVANTERLYVVYKDPLSVGEPKLPVLR